MTTRQNELCKKKEQIFRITFFFFVLFQIFYESKVLHGTLHALHITISTRNFGRQW